MRWVALYGFTLWVVCVVQDVIYYTKDPIYKLRNSVCQLVPYIFTSLYRCFFIYIYFFYFYSGKSRRRALNHSSLHQPSFNLANLMSETFSCYQLSLRELSFNVAIHPKTNAHYKKCQNKFRLLYLSPANLY